ncbi:hypothetical protein BCV69DRAFT_158252 [Microstroma glucosiphilum]|uniref:SAP domain-containing protein n=1 Tax=Pseudomicrostroma glucosiphilum TaxID=1684307 RepID=A0A316UBP2_9BASI|nr:hypothetical protein BCV69DRAFT_158252 [Pseudomicrostroma glucosiphilum]PWN21871.1 hypothetical protein BCV69DRAFT_158252 [Pseudomicrostroma glucosiphilum]
MDCSAMPEALPVDLTELKRPALVQLCKQWDVKAVGKNTDLVEKLMDAQAQRMNGHEAASCDPATTDDDTSMSASSSAEPSRDSLTTPRLPEAALPESVASLEEANCTMPGAFTVTSPHASPSKRQRSPSPQSHSEAMAPAEAAAVTSSSSPRRLAGLPRKSVAPATFAYIPPLPVSKMEASTASPGLYPALPSVGTEGAENAQQESLATDDSVPKFTFTCPLGSTSASSSSSLTASASVLQQLNARLAASGVPPATLTSSSMRPMLSSSPSASSLIRSKSSNDLAAPRGAERFERAHQKQWSKTGSIAEHWSLEKKAKVEEGSSNRFITGLSKGAAGKGTRTERHGASSGVTTEAKSEADTAPTARKSSPAATASDANTKTASGRRPLPALVVRKPRSSLGSAILSKGTIRKPYAAKLYEKNRSRNVCEPRMAHEAPKGKGPVADAKAHHESVSALLPTHSKENALSLPSVYNGLHKHDSAKPSVPALSAKPAQPASSSAATPSLPTSSRSTGPSSFHPYARPAQSQARRPGAPSTPASLNAVRVLETKRRAAEESRRKIVEARAAAAAGKSVAVNALAAK